MPLDDVRLRQGEQVVVADERSFGHSEPIAAVAGLVRPVALDRRAHRAVDDHDPPDPGGRSSSVQSGRMFGSPSVGFGWVIQARAQSFLSGRRP